jgi:hypothetical protein
MGERQVLIHLNITVDAQSDLGTGVTEDEATYLAVTEYLRAHNIPVDDIALIDPQ